MTEVIDLRSSPPGSSVNCSSTHNFRQALRSAISTLPDRNPHFSSDEFNSSIFDDPGWFELHSAKKRKRSHSEIENRPLSPLFSQDQVIPAPLRDQDLLPTSKLDVSIAKAKTGTPAPFIWDDQGSDPITFTSSAPETRTLADEFLHDAERNEDEPASNAPFSLSQPTTTVQARFSERTANLLANISTGITHRSERYGFRTDKPKSTAREDYTLSAPGEKTNTKSCPSDDILDSSQPGLVSKTGTIRNAAAERKAQQQNKAATRAAKEKEKDNERESKRLAREQKAREKQLAADIAEVNKSKTDKKNSTPEMMLDVSACLQDTSLGNQVHEYMKQLGVESCFSRVPPQSHTMVQWRRKVSSRYDEELGHWVPVPERVERERHVLVYLPAQSFVDIATRNRKGNAAGSKLVHVRAHVFSVKQSHPLCKPIYLIEGLSTWMRKNRNAQNRAYQAAVRGQVQVREEELPVSSQQNEVQPKKPCPSRSVDEDLIEDALLELQVEENCLVHQTTCATDTAYWIKNFTEHISTIPYRQERITANETTAFCMDIGQVKTGDDVKDTYVKMLQEVQRVTPAMAYGIASEYPNVRILVNGFKQHGPDMLQDVRKSANKNGAVSDTRLGPKISRRLYKVFTSLDPASADGIA